MGKGIPVIVGEVLFDVFTADNKTVLGGAPFNVAWHLQGFGLQPLMVTAVGADEHGNQVIKTMAEWGMDTRCVKVDNKHPTGSVTVSLQDGIPSYDILAEQAYDFIDAEPVLKVLGEEEADSFGVMYYGSLVSRTERSQAQVSSLSEGLQLPCFVDINLRTPWWSHETVDKALNNARWVKLNEEELAVVMHEEVMDEKTIPDNVLKIMAQRCLDQFSLELLIVTLGDKGAFCVTQEGVVEGEPERVSQVVDTVGAGDSFSAVMIYGLQQHWPLQTTLNRALKFAAKICEIRGATTTDRSLYDSFLRQW